MVEADQSKICSLGWQAGDPGEPVVQDIQRFLLEDSLLPGEAGIFVLF